MQLASRGSAWLLAELARWLPSQCVMVIAPQTEDPRDGFGGYGTPQIQRLEVWRGRDSVRASATERDPADAAQWSPYSTTALRRHEAAAGCTDPAKDATEEGPSGA